MLVSEINFHVHGSSVCAELNPGIRLIGGLKRDVGGEESRETVRRVLDMHEDACNTFSL